MFNQQTHLPKKFDKYPKQAKILNYRFLTEVGSV